MRLDLAVLVFHVSANVVWVGSLLAVLVVAGVASEPVEARARLARKVYVSLAVPGFLVSFIFGLVRLGLDWRYYLVTTHFMHVKLAFAAVAIVVHHLVGARLGKMRRGGIAVRGTGWTGLAFGLATLGAIIMAVVEPF